MPNHNRFVIAIDFDGTLVDHVYPKIGDPVPGALEWCRYLQGVGANLILHTVRSGRELDEAVEFCRHNGLGLFGVNENPEQAAWSTSRKIYAHLYIDDAALGCPLLPCIRRGGRPCVDWRIAGPEAEAALRKALDIPADPIGPQQTTRVVPEAANAG